MWDLTASWADWLFGLSNVVLIVGAAAVLIGTIGSVMMSGVREQFSNERISANEKATEQARSESDLAKKGAADANERAAKLEKDAAEARQETERIKGLISWRVIPVAAAQTLENALSRNPGTVNLRWTDGDPEALFLAIQFSRIFSQAKWQVAPGSVKPANAIVMQIHLPDSGTKDADNLRAAFTEADIPFSPEGFPRGASFMVTTVPGAPVLMVGSRPPAVP